MLARNTKLFAGLLLVLFPAASFALDYRSVSAPRAVMYDAPSASAKKRYSVTQFYPVEVIVNLNQWVKVRDKTGELAWMEVQSLSEKRTLLVLESADVMAGPETSAALVFRVEKDVALEWVQAPIKGWVKVKHKDGLTGFIPVEKVWGL